MEPACSLPLSQAPATISYPEPQPQSQSVETQASFPLLYCQKIRPQPRTCKPFCRVLSVYGEELLAPRPTGKLEDHPLSTARDCLLSIFAATLHTWWPLRHLQPEDAPRCGDNDTLTCSRTCLLMTTVNKRNAAPP